MITDEELLEAYGDTLNKDDFAQSVASGAIPVACVSLSMLSVIVAFLEACAEHTSGNGNVVTRVVLAYQVALTMLIAPLLLGGVPAPRVLDEFVIGAQGSVATCTAQAFFLQLGTVCAMLFDTLLTTTFLLIVRYNWREGSLRKLEKICHVLIWPFGLANAILPLFFQTYNVTTSGTCWTQSVPINCNALEDQQDCILGSRYEIFSFIVGSLTVLTMTYSIGAMIAIYLHVRKTETRTRRYAASSVSFASTIDRARETAYQGILHASTIPIAFGPLIFTVKTTGTYETLDALIYSCSGLLGFFTMLVFIRPRKMRTIFGKIMKQLLTKLSCGLCFCCPGKPWRQSDRSNTHGTSSLAPSSSRRSGSKRSDKAADNFYWSQTAQPGQSPESQIQGPGHDPESKAPDPGHDPEPAAPLDDTSITSQPLEGEGP